MIAARTTLLLNLFDCMLSASASADALFALARDNDAEFPDEARSLRSIARLQRVKLLEMEAQLATLHDGPGHLADEPY